MKDDTQEQNIKYMMKLGFETSQTREDKFQWHDEVRFLKHDMPDYQNYTLW